MVTPSAVPFSKSQHLRVWLCLACDGDARAADEVLSGALDGEEFDVRLVVSLLQERGRGLFADGRDVDTLANQCGQLAQAYGVSQDFIGHWNNAESLLKSFEKWLSVHGIALLDVGLGDDDVNAVAVRVGNMAEFQSCCQQLAFEVQPLSAVL
jgi:hypothetical protein